MTREPDIVVRARALLAAGRAADADQLTDQPAQSPDASHSLIAARASVLKALGRMEESLAMSARAARNWPDSAVAWHNLAAALGDQGRYQEALDAVARARGFGLDAGATWLVEARALRGLRRYDDAIAAYQAAVARDAQTIEAIQELCQMLWIARRDLGAGLAVLDEADRAGADCARINHARVQLLEVAGHVDESRATAMAAARRRPREICVNLLAVQAAVQVGAVADAMAFADQALTIAPRDLQSHIHKTISLLAANRADEALMMAERATRIDPDAMDAWGWLATAARAAGDDRAATLLDYETLIHSEKIAAPAGWPDLATFLVDLPENWIRCMTD